MCRYVEKKDFVFFSKVLFNILHRLVWVNVVLF